VEWLATEKQYPEKNLLQRDFAHANSKWDILESNSDPRLENPATDICGLVGNKVFLLVESGSNRLRTYWKIGVVTYSEVPTRNLPPKKGKTIDNPKPL